MNFVIWIIIGLVAGLAGKAIMPGSKSEPGGWVGTILLGVAGSFLGGFLGNMFFGVRGNGFNAMSIVLSIVGACLLIGLMRLISRGK